VVVQVERWGKFAVIGEERAPISTLVLSTSGVKGQPLYNGGDRRTVSLKAESDGFLCGYEDCGRRGAPSMDAG
jgi:hypothetical protein